MLCGLKELFKHQLRCTVFTYIHADFLVFCFMAVLWNDLIMEPKSACNIHVVQNDLPLLSNPGWPVIHNAPASTPQMLGSLLFNSHGSIMMVIDICITDISTGSLSLCRWTCLQTYQFCWFLAFDFVCFPFSV